jgi:Ni/Fe-hydrogenase subunit HybB-like protein
LSVRVQAVAPHGRDFFLIVFVLETALFLIPAFVFLSGRVENARTRLVAALSAVAAGALWRVNAFLTCYNGGESFQYWPSWGEIAVTVGMAAIGVAVIAITRLLPVVVVHDTPVPASIAAFVLSAKPGEDSGRSGAPATP